jgi:hypothetical protein
VCVALLHLGYSLWMGSRRARMSAAALIGLGLLGFVVATVNGFPVNGLVGLVVFGFLGGVGLLLSRGAVR